MLRGIRDRAERFRRNYVHPKFRVTHLADGSSVETAQDPPAGDDVRDAVTTVRTSRRVHRRSGTGAH